jgi:putative DNA primase/helicase
LAENFGLQPLLGKTLGIVSDLRLGRGDNSLMVERLLSISGDDKLTVARKHKESVHCTLPTRIVILSNELPQIGDSSGALANRMLVFRFTESFLGREDTELTNKLKAELPAIFNWSIRGLKRLRDRGRLLQPESGRDLLAEIQEFASPVSVFAAECCVVDPSERDTVQNLFGAWVDWCTRNGRKEPGNSQTFAKHLLAAFPQLRKVRTRDGESRQREYDGIRLRLGT